MKPRYCISLQKKATYYRSSLQNTCSGKSPRIHRIHRQWSPILILNMDSVVFFFCEFYKTFQKLFLKNNFGCFLSKYHCKKYLSSPCGNFVEWSSLHRVLSELPKVMRKLCLSTKFPLQEIR